MTDQHDEGRVASEQGAALSPTTAPGFQAKAMSLWRRFGPLATELALVVGFYMVYTVMRSASPDRVKLADSHAASIEKIQRALHIDFELTVNKIFVDNPWLADFGSYWYQTLHLVVTAGVLVWVWRRRKSMYGTTRTSLVIVMLGALTTYWAYPLTPPRLHLEGAIFTMDRHPVLFWGNDVKNLANEYAAMPSLHVGWSFWCALTVVLLGTSVWKHLAWLYPLATTFIVLGTANHYILDGVAGASYAIVAVAVSRRLYGKSWGSGERKPADA